ncbi:MAG: signal peptidase I [Oscillospiraceae bacterium]|nr:signal peptidase I [Oscillospiraceae bacterium]
MTEPELQKKEPQEKPFSLKNEIYEWLESGVFALTVVVLIFTFLFRIVMVDGRSMQPTLQDQDRVITVSLFYKPAPGDIVVVTQPNAMNHSLIKRVIAVEGQTVFIDPETGDVSVDGKVLTEPYIMEKINPSKIGDMKYPLTLKDGEVFVMGDNRNNSSDSRDSMIGIIDERYILGKAVLRIFPISDISVLR